MAVLGAKDVLLDSGETKRRFERNVPQAKFATFLKPDTSFPARQQRSASSWTIHQNSTPVIGEHQTWISAAVQPDGSLSDSNQCCKSTTTDASSLRMANLSRFLVARPAVYVPFG